MAKKAKKEEEIKPQPAEAVVEQKESLLTPGNRNFQNILKLREQHRGKLPGQK